MVTKNGSPIGLEDTRKFLLRYLDGLTSTLKTLTHPSRFTILALLLVSQHNFQYLVKETGLKKSALANHLNMLQESNLVKKIQHGTYQITEDGKSFLLAVKSAYEQSESYKLMLKENQQHYQLAHSFLDRHEKVEAEETEQRAQLTRKFLDRKKDSR